MASDLLYLVTGAVLALMAGRHLRAMLRALPQSSNGHLRLNLFHGDAHAPAHWAEAGLGVVIALFGIWLALTASVLLAARLLHAV